MMCKLYIVTKSCATFPRPNRYMRRTRRYTHTTIRDPYTRYILNLRQTRILYIRCNMQVLEQKTRIWIRRVNV